MHEISSPPRMVAVLHGTASPLGSATTSRLVAAIAAARPDVAVQACYLDVVDPRLPDTLARLREPAIIVPLLLSTGYHVQTDIPAAAAGYPTVRVARHLGPHPLLVDALAGRLRSARGPAPAAVALVGSGSTRVEARTELDMTGKLLAGRIGLPVTALTMADDLAARLAELPRPLAVATYLLAEGQFVSTLRAAAVGIAPVAEPLGPHPALVELAWQRYDEAGCEVR